MSEAKAAKFKVGDRVAVDFSKYWRGEGVVESHDDGFWEVKMSDGRRGGFSDENLTLVVHNATDFSTVNVGDRVRLTGNDEVHEFVVSDVNQHTIGSQHVMFAIDEGWTVEILDRAKLKLPTEPGFYITGSSSVSVMEARRNAHGDIEWFNCVGGFIASNMLDAYAPFTRLVPEVAGDD